MKSFALTDAGPELSPDDVRDAEASVGVSFPRAIVAAYLRANGGTPSEPYWRADEDDDAGILISHFLPMKYGADGVETVESTFAALTSRGVLDRDVVPIAVDWGSNFVCFDRDGAIYFVTTDSWSSDLTAAENRSHSRRRIADSFDTFVANLGPDDELG